MPFKSLALKFQFHIKDPFKIVLRYQCVKWKCVGALYIHKTRVLFILLQCYSSNICSVYAPALVYHYFNLVCTWLQSAGHMTTYCGSTYTSPGFGPHCFNKDLKHVCVSVIFAAYFMWGTHDGSLQPKLLTLQYTSVYQSQWCVSNV